MDPLGRSLVYRGFHRDLTARFGREQAALIWQEANAVFLRLQKEHPNLDADSRMMILPAAALCTALSVHAPQDALPLLTAYGTRVGQKLAGFIHAFTSLPGVPELLWRHMPRLMRTMSSPEKGYTRRIVSETSSLVGVDILSCPLHEAAKRMGVPQAALPVCAMDKACMCGFRRIRYTRSTSVAEGHTCCDYRLSYDRDKP